jgi:hypothetical protein
MAAHYTKTVLGNYFRTVGAYRVTKEPVDQPLGAWLGPGHLALIQDDPVFLLSGEIDRPPGDTSDQRRIESPIGPAQVAACLSKQAPREGRSAVSGDRGRTGVQNPRCLCSASGPQPRPKHRDRGLHMFIPAGLPVPHELIAEVTAGISSRARVHVAESHDLSEATDDVLIGHPEGHRRAGGLVLPGADGALAFVKTSRPSQVQFVHGRQLSGRL